MKSRLPIFLVCFVFLFCIFAPAKVSAQQAASDSEKIVEVEGCAAIRDGDESAARQAAEREACRSALEKGIEFYVEGITKIKNFEDIKDKIFSQAEGIVKDLKVNREWVDEGGVLHISATCRVALAALDDVLGPAVVDMLGNPRVLIFIHEWIDDATVFFSTTEGEVLKVFEKAGYRVIDQTQLDQSLKEIDAAQYSQPAFLHDLARLCRAEILISGRAYSRVSSRQKIQGINFVGVRSTVQLEGVLTDSAYIVGLDTADAKTIGVTLNDAAINGFRKAAPTAARNIVHKIAYQMIRGTLLGGRTVNVKIANMLFQDARTLENALKNVDGVKAVCRRGYGKTDLGDKTLELDVVSDKTTNEIAEVLLDMGVDIEQLGGAPSIEGRTVSK
jgi:hypothetical protein